MQNGLSYLSSLGLHKVKPGLDRIKKLLKSLGNPEDKIPGIIIAGTNGKGYCRAIHLTSPGQYHRKNKNKRCTNFRLQFIIDNPRDQRNGSGISF